MVTADESGLIQHQDGKRRCWWCGDDAEYVAYHDSEWGRRVDDDRHLFEKICLEGFQAGLSWLTILRKRAAFRESFAQFQMEQVAKFGDVEIERLLQNAGIVRHRGKIAATINNANRAIELAEEFGSLKQYFDQYQPKDHAPIHSRQQIVAQTAESQRMSKDLKKRGWAFVGPTTCYAFMQSVGIVNDHLVGCDFHSTHES